MKPDVSLVPNGEGWSLFLSDGSPRPCATLIEAAAQIPRQSAIHIALPAHALIIERLRLPATQQNELEGMVQLQWEKALPVPTDEITGDLLVLHSTSNETTLLTVAAFQATLAGLCQPLIERNLLPAGASVYFEHIASRCPTNATVLAVYPEHGGIVLVVVEDGRPGWAHVLPDTKPELLVAELPQLLLTAGLSGIPTAFHQILIASELISLRSTLQEYFECPASVLPPPEPPLSGSLNLLPKEWHQQRHRQSRFRTALQRFAIAGLVYLVALIIGGIYLFMLQQRVQRLDGDIAKLRPQLAIQQGQQSRSNALSPAFDPHRYALELLFLLQRQLPSTEVRLTEFDQSQQQWRIMGEAPSANQAIEFVRRIRQDPELATWQIDSGPPQLLTNERAQFSVVGKP